MDVPYGASAASPPMMNTLIVYACISVTHEWDEIRGNKRLVAMEQAQSGNARNGNNPDSMGHSPGDIDLIVYLNEGG